MDEVKQQLIDRLKSSNNILVTVGRNPSVDQLSAMLGLTLFLNKQGKHAAAVFSGEVPSTLEFLQPEATIEKNTDSLRDFIIALDKYKADKLRYKVEDDVVRIFITPYKTSITQDDFEFSQGDFNVDMVVAIGVQLQEDLDEAIVAHGRILHDATVTSINISTEGGIGTINWHSPDASSLSELVCDLVQTLDPKMLDEQIATAILTGIVAETDRFSNEKTTANTMSASAALMAAGANQQLVATKLQEEPHPADNNAGDDFGNEPQEGGASEGDQPKTDDGTLEIDHAGEEDKDEEANLELPEPDENAAVAEEEESEEPDDINESLGQNKPEDSPQSGLSPGSKLITEPPTMGGTLTSGISQEPLDPSTDPFSLPQAEAPKLLDHKNEVGTMPPLETDIPEPPQPPSNPEPVSDDSLPLQSFAPQFSDPAPVTPDQPGPGPGSSSATSDSPYSTLADLEESINSSHAAPDDSAIPATDDTAADSNDLNAARDEVSKALTEASAAGNTPPEAIEALNAHPMTEGLHSNPTPPSSGPAPLPEPDAQKSQNSPHVTDPTAPPPVPPPIPFQFGQQPPQQ